MSTNEPPSSGDGSGAERGVRTTSPPPASPRVPFSQRHGVPHIEPAPSSTRSPIPAASGTIPPISTKGTLPSSVQKALLTLDKLKTKLDTIERQRKEPIAVIGMSCRFPGGATTPEDFFRLLLDGTDAVSAVPDGRWPDPIAAGDPGLAGARFGAFLREDVSLFDPSFFGISPREAERLDPQQRLLLELVWEALERAGQVPLSLSGSRTGVYVGLMTTDYLQLGVDGPEDSWDGYVATGGAHCFPAGRIAYTFGFQGPTMVVDTACSSSLVATHLACQSLRGGESDMAIAGGANLMLSSVMSRLTARTNALSPDGRCKTFDARANGYVRGEGAGVLVLKRLSDAERDGDPIFALIRGSAVNQDGRSTGLTTPNVLSQQAMLRQALSNARLTPEEIGYVETHGTGTPLGDPIELEALRAVLGGPREPPIPCVLGAVKTNIGHLEAAAGVAGMLKAILSLQRGVIPRNLHLRALNPRISLEGTPFVMPSENRPWPRGDRPRLAGVSSFGLSGTNAHVILEEAPTPQPLTPEETAARELPGYLVPLSARSPEALRELAFAQAKVFEGKDSLYDVMYTAATRRMFHEHRLAVVGRTRAEIASALSAFHERGAAPSVVTGKAVPLAHQKIVFVFPGQGSQWVGMARRLLREEPVFQSAMELCHESIRRLGRFSLLDEIAADEWASQLSNIHVVQSTIFAIQVSLAALWKSWGIEPHAVVGHSMGEVAAARVAGVLSLEDAAKVICRRSMALERIAGQGAMAQVELSPAEAALALRGFESVLSVAVHNGPRSTVISGDPTAIEVVLGSLEAKGVFCRRVKVDVASHSPQVDPITDDLAAVLNLRPRPAQIPMMSTVTGDFVQGPEMTAAYWVKNLREPVLFSEVTQRLMDDRQIIFLEVSPHPILLPSIEENLRARSQEGLALPSFRRNSDERRDLLESLGAMWAAGAPASFKVLLPEKGRVAQLPTYPWQRQRYWHPGAPVRGRKSTRAAAAGPAPLLGPPVATSDRPDARVWQRELGVAAAPYLAQHRLQGAVVLPGSVYVEAALEAAREVFGDASIVVRDMVFLAPMTLGGGDALVEVSLTPEGPGKWSFRWSSTSEAEPDPGSAREWVLHATAEISTMQALPSDDPPSSTVQRRCTTRVPVEELDRASAKLGLDLGPAFRTVREVLSGPGEVLARVGQPEGAGSGFLIHPAVMDACLRTLLAATAGEGDEPRILAGIREVRFHSPAEGDVFVHGRSRPADGEDSASSLRLLGASGRVLAEIDGVRARAISRDLLVLRALPEVLFSVEWKAQGQAPEPSGAPGAWLVFDGGEGTGEAVRRALEARGASVTLVRATGDGAPREVEAPEMGRAIDPTRPDEITSALRAAVASAGRLAGVVHLLALGPEPETSTELLGALERRCGSALSLAQALAEEGSPAPRLVLVTRGTQAVGQAKVPVAAAGATVWGLGRAIATEHPELGCLRVDLDPRARPDEASALVAEVLSSSGEDEVALRAEGRFAPRVTRGRMPANPGSPPVRGDATYLITGGLGGLGLIAAGQLVAEGARHLVLVGRSGAATPAQEEAITGLRASGAEVHVARADIADEAQLDALLRDVESRMPPVRGVLHTAGVLDDGLIQSQSWERFARVFGAKVLGAHNLHRRTAGLPLDFFVLYSSLSALLAPPGVSNYVAANAYLDALAHHRRAAGLTATSVDWGLFEGVGMAVKAASSQGTSEASRGFTARQAAALLGAVLRAAHTHVGVADIDVATLAAAHPSLASAPRLRELLRGGAAPVKSAGDSAASASILGRLLSLPASGRGDALRGYLRAELGRILRMDPAQLDMSEPLGNRGFDSIMGMELRGSFERALGVKVSMGDIMANARGDALVDLVAGRLPESLPPGAALVAAGEAAGGALDEASRAPSDGASRAPDEPASRPPAAAGRGEAPPPVVPGAEERDVLDAASAPPTEPGAGARATGRWVVVPGPRPSARMRLFCFPYAGGAASVFSAWQAALPPEVELCAIQYPGRHERLKEALPTSVEEMVREIVPALLPYLDRPFATFGHCLGAIVMFEVLRVLAAQGKKPVHVFASAAPPPHRYLVPTIAGLSREQFTSLLRALGFAHESILSDPDAERHLLPAVRSDFGVAASYVGPDGPALDVPVTAFAGLEDSFAPVRVVDEWRTVTTAHFEQVAFPGGHYFIVPERGALLGHVGEALLLRLASLDAAADGGGAWLVRPDPQPRPRLRVICFPGAGQSSADYQGFSGAFGPDVEVCFIEPPGRGAREAELPLGSAHEIGAAAARAVASLSDRPFVLFGHDLGALVMFEAIRSLRALGATEPAHVVVSAAMAPEKHYFAPIHHLPSDRFRAELLRLGVDVKLPERTLRADAAALAGFAHDGRTSLGLPLTVIAADQDGFVPLAGARAWLRHARPEGALHMRSGGHAWSREGLALLAQIGAALRAQVPA